MAQQCPSCDGLRSEVGQLRNEVGVLKQQISNLTRRLGNVMSGVVSTVLWIRAEIEKPTMPRRDVMPYLVMRLNDVLGSAQ